ncbi:MAG: hypothetical protein K8R77_15200 [Anaerolineaceae bacterium]|nr:hypothetical protein [Anaerolineaceae bacterium]
MLITLLLWAYLLPLGWLYGRFTLHVLAHSLKLDDDPLSFSLTWLAGLGTLTTLASFLSLFIKLALAAQLIVLAGGLLILIWLWRTHRLHFAMPAWQPLGLLLGALVLITVLEISTHTPGNPDTGLYHAQTIRWIESFPVVPGLGNLHSRLAYNSSWLTLNALFSFAFLGGQSYHILPGLLFLVITGRLLQRGLRLLGSRGHEVSSGKPADWLRLMLIPLAFLLLAGEISSPGTDLPAVLLSWLVFSEWLALLEEKETTSPLHRILLILFVLWTVTIKLSSLPLLLAALFIWWRNIPDKQPRTTAKLFAAAAVLLLPWVARSLILSGYLIYPGLTLDPFHFDWRIPAEAVQRESQVITAWARFSAGEIETVLAMSLPEWVSAWFHNQTPNRQAIFLLVAAAPFGYALLLGLLSLIKRGLAHKLWGTLQTYGLPLLAAYAGIAFWFLKAPFFRFGYAFLIPALTLWLLPPILMLDAKRLQAFRLPLVFALLLAVYQGSVLARSFEPQTITSRLVQPADYVNLPTAPCNLYDSRVWCAEQFGVCGYQAFPCVPGADPLVARRSPDLSDGYRHLNLP